MINKFHSMYYILSKTRAMFLLLFLFITLDAVAQTATIKGNVVDEDNMGLAGAHVRQKGSTQGVVTDIDGNFTLKLSGNEPLVVSFIGMKDATIDIVGKTEVKVMMEYAAQSLEGAVAIGYQTVKRKDLTGSVSSVSAEALAAVPVASAVEAITGKMAGVQVTTTEGSPDAEVTIRVRGGGSITGDNTPLYIVDGFPVESISDIAPTDIESIDVLKDASSTAIYGSRGANGVLIVTTKSGKAGKVSVNYNAYYGFKKIAETLNTLPVDDYVKWQYELFALDDKVSTYEKYFGKYQDIDLYSGLRGNNWQDQIYGRTGTTFNHNLSVTGGSDKFKYSFGYNFTKDKAIMQLSGYKRTNMNLKLNHKILKNVSLDFSARYSDTEVTGGGANEKNEISSADSRLKHCVIYSPIPVGDIVDDGLDDYENSNLVPPMTSVIDSDKYKRTKGFNVGGAVTWDVIKNLRLKSEVGLDDNRNDNDLFYGKTHYYVKNNVGAAAQGLPAIKMTHTETTRFRNTNTATYSFSEILPENHNLSVLAGQETLITKSKYLETTSNGFPELFTFDQAKKLTTLAAESYVNNFYQPDDKLVSFFGRVNYDYMSKYIFAATLRADGSSKFARGNRWGIFPSVAVAWRISAEDFMAKTGSWLDDLKLRLSYGTAGNNNIPSGQMSTVYSSNNTTWINGISNYWSPSKNMANPDLKWETTITRNLGLDYSLFQGKLSGTLEAYLNTTKDLLIQFPVSGTGYDYQYRNMGKTENRGIEFSANWTAIQKQDYGLSFGFNIGFNKNKIKSLGIMNNFGQDSNWASTEIGVDYWVAVGGSVGEIYGYRNDGRYEVSDFKGYNESSKKWELKDGVADASAVVGTLRPGSMKLKDLDDSGTVTVDDREVIGNVNPTCSGGFNINANYKGFDLSANFTFSLGNDVYNANKIEYTSTSKYTMRNMITMMADGKRWTNLRADGTISNDGAELEAMNANTTMWSPYMARFVLSDWAVEDGSFLRLSTLTLGYTLPANLTKKIYINRLRVYATAYNVFCLTDYSGYDPEVSTRRKTNLTPGVDYSAYPKSRSIVFGINLTF